MGEGEFLTGVFWGLDVEFFMGDVGSRSDVVDCTTLVTIGDGDIDDDVEGKGSHGDNVSNGITLKVFGGVCFGVTTFVLIDGSIVRDFGFRHPCIIQKNVKKKNPQLKNNKKKKRKERETYFYYYSLIDSINDFLIFIRK